MDANHDESHVHHWHIVMQTGASSPGACSCGGRMDFANSLQTPGNRPLRNHHVRRYPGPGAE